MLRPIFLVMITLALITACTATDPITDVPFSTATARPIETLAAPSSLGDAAIPSDFTAGDPIIVGDFGTFSFTVSGEVVTEMSTGTLLYNYLPADGRLGARNQLYIAASDSTSSQQLSFEFAPQIQLGQYNLVALTDYAPGNVSVAYSRLVFNGTDTRIEAFSDNINGTLIVTRIGEALSGQFQFSADFIETSLTGEVDVQSVEVTGQFEDVPYRITLNDPFEIDVPLPTRNFTSDGTDQP
ncbi:MAG: hypothetical protein WBC91_17860 [Phototrophicaceae bacterium]